MRNGSNSSPPILRRSTRAPGSFSPAPIEGVKQLAAAGCQAIWIEECLTDQLGPERFARYNLRCCVR